MTHDELQKTLKKRTIDLSDFFSEVLAESRDLDRTYRDFVTKVLLLKVKNGEISPEKVKELLSKIVEYNQNMEKLILTFNSADDSIPEIPIDSPSEAFLPPCGSCVFPCLNCRYLNN